MTHHGTVPDDEQAMRHSLFGLLLVTACTSPPHSDLEGTWERHDTNGAVLEQMTFDANGSFRATSTRSGATFETRRDEWRDLRDTSGSYTISGDTARLSGRTADDIRYDLDFTFYADDAVFVRGAFVEYEDESPEDLVRHFRSLHSMVYGGMNDIGHARSLDVDLQLTDVGGRGWFGMAFDNPVFLGADGDGGQWRTADDGAVELDLKTGTDRYQVLGDGDVLGRFDTRASSMDAPINVGDTAYIFTRVQ
jgi:hypothetical protein